MELSLATRTDVGRVRKNNEDSFFADEALGLFIVCDGMGGHNAGEVASGAACDLLHTELSEITELRDRYEASGKPSDIKAIRKAVETAVLNACKEIHKRATKTPEQAGMGTTCTMVLLAGHNKGVLGHVGDSRLFVVRGGGIHQLSEDHTYVNELIKRGALTKEQARNHPHGNVLSRALGVQPSVAVDTLIFDMDPGDTYLLCSDGLYNYYPNHAELQAALSGADLAQALEGLVATALERGGHDNCTGVAFRVSGAITDANQAIAAEQRIEVLKRIPIFAHLTYNELVKVLGLTQLAAVHAGETIITEGDDGDELFVVLAGEVDVSKGGKHLATLKAGAHMGEMAMIDSSPRSATVVAKTDGNLLLMRREEFFGLIRSEAVIATKLLWSFVQSLSTRLRETNEALQGARRQLDTKTPEFEIFVDET